MAADTNPCDDGSDLFYAWYKGWRSGKRDHEWRQSKRG
jgi:hypothetical protein